MQNTLKKIFNSYFNQKYFNFKKNLDLISI
jgi:hypothetical protein